MAMNAEEFEKYRAQCTADSDGYEDFLSVKLLLHGIVLQNFKTKKMQYDRGENVLGMEIKLDRRMAETGNVYIEIAEKAGIREGDYFPSGIYRGDETWLYGIGDYKEFFIFSKRTLLQIHKAAPSWITLKQIPTSKGFVMSQAKAREYVEKVILFVL